MNKILVEKDKFIVNEISNDSEEVVIDKNEEILLEIVNTNRNFKAKVLDGITATINILDRESDYTLEFEILKQARLVVNSLSVNSNKRIKISLEKEASINYCHSMLADRDSVSEINIIHNQEKANSKIINHGCNYGHEKLVFKVDGIITKDATNSICEQDNKIINNRDGNSLIIPNLLVDNKEVIANHSAYIGNFKKEIIFYMTSRGISEKLCYNLLLKGFLMGKMSLNYLIRDKFLKIINEWDEKHE